MVGPSDAASAIDCESAMPRRRGSLMRPRSRCPSAGLSSRPDHGTVPAVTVLAEPTSSAITQGIRVTVTSSYIAEQSAPDQGRYVFAYTVAIANEGDATAQLRTRHWVITDATGKVEEVRGDGVIGEQPRLGPGQRFQYTSRCVLTTPVGTMASCVIGDAQPAIRTSAARNGTVHIRNSLQREEA